MELEGEILSSSLKIGMRKQRRYQQLGALLVRPSRYMDH